MKGTTLASSAQSQLYTAADFSKSMKWLNTEHRQKATQQCCTGQRGELYTYKHIIKYLFKWIMLRSSKGVPRKDRKEKEHKEDWWCIEGGLEWQWDTPEHLYSLISLCPTVLLFPASLFLSVQFSLALQHHPMFFPLLEMNSPQWIIFLVKIPYHLFFSISLLNTNQTNTSSSALFPSPTCPMETGPHSLPPGNTFIIAMAATNAA